MAREPDTADLSDVPINPDDPTDMHGADVADPVLPSDAITNLNQVPNPAEYDEELAEARLVEQAVNEPVPGVHEDEVEREGVQPIAKTVGNVVPDSQGGTDDMTAALGLDTDDGEPDDPDEVIFDDEEE